VLYKQYFIATAWKIVLYSILASQPRIIVKRVSFAIIKYFENVFGSLY
jgi:hypothetical protein